jgi:hypothetical protein
MADKLQTERENVSHKSSKGLRSSIQKICPLTKPDWSQNSSSSRVRPTWIKIFRGGHHSLTGTPEGQSRRRAQRDKCQATKVRLSQGIPAAVRSRRDRRALG